MALTSLWVALACVVVILGGCGVDKSTTYWEDSMCVDPPNVRPATESTAFVGLFLEDGTPLCRNDAIVTFRQGRYYDGAWVPFVYSTRYFARVTDDWAMHMFTGGDGPCNVYEPYPHHNAWLRCSPPVEYEIHVEGCEPVSGTFTRNDDWFPWKDPYSLTDDNWFVPVRMRCSGVGAPDASVPMTPDAAVPDASDAAVLDAAVL